MTLADNDSTPITTTNPLPVSFASAQPVTIPKPELSTHSGIFSTVGSVAIWTPAAGKKFRLKAISWTFGILNAVNPLISLKDGGTLLMYITSPPATGGTMQSGYILLPEPGILSAAVNNVLAVDSNGNGAGIAVTVIGTEE